jgi:hypothetical protein
VVRSLTPNEWQDINFIRGTWQEEMNNHSKHMRNLKGQYSTLRDLHNSLRSRFGENHRNTRTVRDRMRNIRGNYARHRNRRNQANSYLGAANSMLGPCRGGSVGNSRCTSAPRSGCTSNP